MVSKEARLCHFWRAQNCSISNIFNARKNTTGLKMNYLFKDAGENVIDFFVKSIKPAPSRDAVKVFLNFVEKGPSSINYGNVGDALDFG